MAKSKRKSKPTTKRRAAKQQLKKRSAAEEHALRHSILRDGIEKLQTGMKSAGKELTAEEFREVLQISRDFIDGKF